jgi:hypothetical protein
MSMRCEDGRGVRDDERGGVELGERLDVGEVNGGRVGGDQASLELLKS